MSKEKPNEPLTKYNAVRLAKSMLRISCRDDAYYEKYQQFDQLADEEEKRVLASPRAAKYRALRAQREKFYRMYHDRECNRQRLARQILESLELDGVTASNKAALRKLLKAK